MSHVGNIISVLIASLVFTFSLHNNIIPDMVNIISLEEEFQNQLVEALVPTPDEYFRFDETTGTILGYFDTNDAPKNVVIPSKIDGVDVTAIGLYAFRADDGFGGRKFRKNRLESVVIPEGIKYIGSSAFASNNLTKVYIPDSVTTIEGAAFSGNKLKEIRISANMDAIEESVFSDNELEIVLIPDSIKTIGYRSFANNKLMSINIPESVEEIETLAFMDNQLSRAYIPFKTKLKTGYIGDGEYSPFDNQVEILRY